MPFIERYGASTSTAPPLIPSLSPGPSPIFFTPLGQYALFQALLPHFLPPLRLSIYALWQESLTGPMISITSMITPTPAPHRFNLHPPFFLYIMASRNLKSPLSSYPYSLPYLKASIG